MRLALGLFAATLAAAPLSNIVQLDPSGTLALDSAGRVWAWGPSAQAYFAKFDTAFPTPTVIAQSSNFTKAVAGRTHFLVLRSDQTVCALGFGQYGQLGLGAATSAFPCTAIPGLTGVKDIVASGLKSYALAHDGTVWVWGAGATYDSVSRLRVNTVSPQRILTGATAIAANLALRSDGSVWAWDRVGSVDIPSPSPVSGLSSIAVIASWGDPVVRHALAIHSDGSVWAWGNPLPGFAGNRPPAKVAGLPAPAVAIASGGAHNLIALQDGSVWAWGGNFSGQLGNGSNIASAVPVRVSGLSASILALAAGSGNSAALVSGGTLRAWGGNLKGELGLGISGLPFSHDPVPAPVPGLNAVSAIATGPTLSLALRTDGTVWSWGGAADGNPLLGDCSVFSRASPGPTPITNAVAISAGFAHAIALLRDGRVLAWGDNTLSQLGEPGIASRCAPQPVPGLSGVIAISAGHTHNAVLKDDGTVWVWGSGAYGPADPRAVPVQVPGLSAVRAVAAGSSTYAIRSDGSLAHWRYDPLNYNPAVVPGLPPIRKVVAGSNRGLAVDNAGALWEIRPNTPPYLGPISGILDVTAIEKALAVKTDNTVWTWEGPTGAGVTKVPGAGSAQAVSTHPGGNHALALLLDGTVRAWGSNSNGQLGNGTAASAYDRTTPVVVPALPVIPYPNALFMQFTSGSSGTLTADFSHNGGAGNLSILNILINDVVDGRRACYLAFLPSGPGAGTLVLVNDAGSAGGPFAGALQIPGSGRISNGQCAVEGLGSWVGRIDDSRLRINFNISFAASFSGRRTVYLAGRDADGGNTGWIPQGVWPVPYAAPQVQQFQSVSTNPAFIAYNLYDMTLSHALGASHFEIINLLINDTIEGRRSCYLAVLPATGAVVLVNDAGEAGGPFAGSLTAGSPGQISNSQCAVYGEFSSAVIAGNELRLRLAVGRYANATPAPWVVYAAARDRLGNNTGWQPMAVVNAE